MKNKTRKYYKGGIVFTKVLNNIFKQCSRLMVQKQLTNIESLIINEPQETIPVAKFISDVMACAMNSGNILCFTAANFGLMPFLPAGTPHCILSNIAAILVLYKLDYLGRRDIIKTKNTKVSILAEEDEEDEEEKFKHLRLVQRREEKEREEEPEIIRVRNRRDIARLRRGALPSEHDVDDNIDRER
jgi:hypothetical protein